MGISRNLRFTKCPLEVEGSKYFFYPPRDTDGKLSQVSGSKRRYRRMPELRQIVRPGIYKLHVRAREQPGEEDHEEDAVADPE